MKNSGDIGAVGDKLVELAIDDPAGIPAEAYVRSAFNRYYYACFLEVRFMLSQIDQSWTKTSHQQIPCRLRENLNRRARKIIKRNSKNLSIYNQIDPNHCLIVLKDMTNELANEIETAYSIRKIVDYKPNVNIEFYGWETSIDGIALQDAQRWHSRAVEKAKEVLKVWHEINPN